MKIENAPFVTSYTSSTRKVERAGAGDANTYYGSSRGTAMTFAQLKEKIRLLEVDTRPKSALQSNIDPALATAINAANRNQKRLSPLQPYQQRNVDIVHDKPTYRGIGTNIEV